ncbi:N-acetylmuramoyl-L-alanine amidase [Fulvivirga imtechensis]|nr:N-acetylmuramoyl-L-alanine amidase [Fulvivirga imtechensis]
MRKIFTGIFLLFASYSQAQWERQEIMRTGTHTRAFSAEVQPQQHIYAQEKEPVTALAIRYQGQLGEALVRHGSFETRLFPDEHTEDNGLTSNLVIFDEPVYKYELFTGSLSGNIEVILINAGEIKNETEAGRIKEGGNSCEEPAQVDQSVWREGLPAPNYNRSFTDTENIIVHHSATSNELTNYTNVVRNIYLYHTEANGWSDIGYNYLIAPDGTIFKGRDPGAGEQDFVLGAHFCGKNSTTIGVCLMGTFTNVPPSDQALESLNHLLAWKTDKDELDPLGTDPHPLHASLPVIAGHRDGCSTECPGQKTYERLPMIRTVTAESIQACHEETEVVFALYPNPAEVHFKVELLAGDVHDFTLYNMKGHFSTIYPIGKSGNVLTFSVAGLASGIYILHYQSEEALVKRRLVVLN